MVPSRRSSGPSTINRQPTMNIEIPVELDLRSALPHPDLGIEVLFEADLSLLAAHAGGEGRLDPASIEATLPGGRRMVAQYLPAAAPGGGSPRVALWLPAALIGRDGIRLTLRAAEDTASQAG